MSARERLQRRLDGLRDSLEWRRFSTAREHVLEYLDAAEGAGGGAAAPSAYWREELEGFEYLLDASPLIVEKLRHHSYHVTGLKAYEYRSGQDRRQLGFVRKLDQLTALAGNGDLFVPEGPELGGFGHDLGGATVNIDTLKYFEVMIGLQQAAALAPLEDTGERPVVWEIGAGWGGFARVLKTSFPGVTYVIVDLPELFLFSATLLGTTFPDAEIRWYGDVADRQLFTGSPDFVLIPHFAPEAMRPPRLDLALNMVSFQEMAEAQVRAYVHQAHNLGATLVYSLNRDRSPYNTELGSVRDILAERYWVQELDLLPEQYTQMPRERTRPLSTIARQLRQDPGPHAYRHVAGWPKLAR